MAVAAAGHRCHLYGHHHRLNLRRNLPTDEPRTHPDVFHSAGHYERQRVTQVMMSLSGLHGYPLMRLACLLRRAVQSAVWSVLKSESPHRPPEHYSLLHPLMKVKQQTWMPPGAGKYPWASPVYRSLATVLHLSLMPPVSMPLAQTPLVQPLRAVAAQGPVSVMTGLPAMPPDD